MPLGLPVRSIRDSRRTLSKEQRGQLLESFGPFIHLMEQSPRELHSISLTIMVHDGAADGECRVDGETVPELLKAVQSIAWNQNGSNHIFKQFFVLHRSWRHTVTGRP